MDMEEEKPEPMCVYKVFASLIKAGIDEKRATKVAEQVTGKKMDLKPEAENKKEDKAEGGMEE